VPKIATNPAFDELYLWYLGDPDSPQLVGTLHPVASGKGVSLRYAPSWLAAGFPLSPDLPLLDTEHLPAAKGLAVGAVDDARPDRWGERVIQYLDRPRRLSLMEYLYYAGDDRFGALGVSSSDREYLPRRHGPLPKLQSAQAMSVAIAKLNAKEAIDEIETRLVGTGGSFGGAKPKALIDIDGEQWVIKFFNGEPLDVPLVEHASMTLAHQAGIVTAKTAIVPLAAEHAIAVQRFDRAAGRRLHCLSAATVLRAVADLPSEPEFGYPALAQVLRRHGEAKHDAYRQDMAELFRRMVFNILIDNTDDHEKNHALIVAAPARSNSLRLAPAYDVQPANSGQGHQEFLVGDDGAESSLTNAMSQCAMFELSSAQAAQEVLRVIAVVDTWQRHFRSCGVSEADIASLAERIDGDMLLPQRRGFRADDYAGKPTRTRRGPFGR
jgi:serine/threonine-protein kinase HipA